MPRAKTSCSGRLPPLQHVLPPLSFLLLAGWSIPVADAAPRPTTTLGSSSVSIMSILGNDTIKPCSRSRLYTEPPRRKLVQGGGAAANTSCGFYDGDPDRPLVPPPDMGCTTNEAARVWGFCPTRGGSTMDPGPLGRSDPGSVASSCKLTTTCYDSFACKAGCGVSVSGGAVGDEGGRDAVDETGHAVEDGTADVGKDEDEDGDGNENEGENDVAPHLPHISGRAPPRMICMGQEATRYCNMALWIRHNNVRFTSLACGTVAGSTTSIFENPWTAAATRKAPSATTGVISSAITSTPPPRPTAASSSSASAGNTTATTTTTPPQDGDRPAALIEHPDERGKIAGIIIGALAGVVLVASAVLLAAYRRTRHRFGTAMQFIYHSFRSSSGGFGGEDERLRRGGRKPGV